MIDAEIIRIAREMSFPEFSGDARYLEVHQVDRILDELGSPEDDHCNFFTARLLLLLESSPIWGDETYKRVVTKIVDAYFRDYHDHETNFRPVFLLNDIIRFWKTLCLNYEHRRNRPNDDRRAHNASHLKNLKLKFSRMLTCYSTIALLARAQMGLTRETASLLLVEPPSARLLKAADLAGAGDLGEKLLAEYAWFLEVTNQPLNDLLNWIEDASNRDAAFERARAFGKTMFDLILQTSSGSDLLRYALI